MLNVVRDYIFTMLSLDSPQTPITMIERIGSEMIALFDKDRACCNETSANDLYRLLCSIATTICYLFANLLSTSRNIQPKNADNYNVMSLANLQNNSDLSKTIASLTIEKDRLQQNVVRVGSLVWRLPSHLIAMARLPDNAGADAIDNLRADHRTNDRINLVYNEFWQIDQRYRELRILTEYAEKEALRCEGSDDEIIASARTLAVELEGVWYDTDHLRKAISTLTQPTRVNRSAQGPQF